MNKLRLSILILLVLMGLWATAGHYLAPRPTAVMLQSQFIPPGPEWFLEQMPRYDSRPLLTALHVVPSFLFLSLLLAQLSPTLRRRRPRVHRWLGRGLVALGIPIGLSGLVMGVVMPFGGLPETAAIALFGSGFLFSLFMGVLRVRQRRWAEHRYWMLHMVALAFAPVTMRLLFVVSLYTTPWSPQTAFVATMLLSMVLNLWMLHYFILAANTGRGHDRPSFAGQ